MSEELKPAAVHDANVFLPGSLGPVRREVVLAYEHDRVVNQLRAELATLKAGQGGAVAPYGYLREVDGNVQLSIGPARPADRSEGCATPWAAIFAEPPTTAGAVSVPRELLERAIANLALLDSRPRSMCRDCADCNGVCHTTGLDCDVSALTAGLRALLAQSESEWVGP